MNVPSWWAFVLLGLAVYRCWRLLSQDTILDRPRIWFIGGDPSEIPDDATYTYNRRHEWISCPFCSGAWIAAAWWLAWLIWPHGTLVAAVPFALSGAVAVFAAHLDP